MSRSSQAAFGVGRSCQSSSFLGALIHVLFQQPPEFDCLTKEFLRNYHRYADAILRSYLEAYPCAVVTPANFEFELYASGEYSRLLESQWAAE